ncbi:MAG: NADP/NAD-dependent aldehyde dehydrogenase PuuC [Gammaproteobacteria bacterium]|nr:NADP/NAD-dependent aldehyde dehydrogenase PuuC [Gammaproteobacteria bacterium]
MSLLLTREEYESIFNSIALPSGAFIDGRARAAVSGETFETLNPANGQVLNRIASCGRADVDLAVEKAREAFEGGRWSRLHPTDRKKTMIRWCKLIRRNQRELAVLESVDSGKPIQEVENADLAETLHCLEWHAETADKLYDEVAPAGDDAVALVVREPIGVVACVLPWNFPMLMMAWKVGPALAAGNSVIIKPAEQTSMTALRLAELAFEAGVPRGVLNVVPGYGETAGKALGLHPNVDMVSFTGSTDVGRRFLEYAAHSNLKKVVLECGGKNPCVVLEDADNLDVVAEHATQAVFWNMGENCSSNSRLIVHKDVKDALLERILHRIRDWRTGDPLDPVNRLGAIVSREQYDRILRYIEQGKREGADVVLGGGAIEKNNGFFIEPTIFDNVRPEMTIAREEIFGPVLVVIVISGIDEAVKIANDTSYGLAASVFTSNVKRVHRMARAIRAGTVTVNCYGEGDITTPFGGYKQSGFGGRDNSVHAHDQYTELKTIWLDVSDSDIESGID